MVIAWIISVWLLSLAVFVALRAYGTRNRRRVERDRRAAEIAEIPIQRNPSDAPARASERS
jgi:hypothetical protein